MFGERSGWMAEHCVRCQQTRPNPQWRKDHSQSGEASRTEWAPLPLQQPARIPSTPNQQLPLFQLTAVWNRRLSTTARFPPADLLKRVRRETWGRFMLYMCCPSCLVPVGEGGAVWPMHQKVQEQMALHSSYFEPFISNHNLCIMTCHSAPLTDPSTNFCVFCVF